VVAVGGHVLGLEDPLVPIGVGSVEVFLKKIKKVLDFLNFKVSNF
jgi:hypothetical protein